MIGNVVVFVFSDKVEKGEAPMFLKKIGDNEVMEGMTAKFTACVTGIPTPNVSWYVHHFIIIILYSVYNSEVI